MENKEEKVIFFKTHDHRVIADQARLYHLKVKFEANQVEDKLVAEEFNFADETLFYLKKLAIEEEQFHKSWEEAYYAMMQASNNSFWLKATVETMRKKGLPVEEHPELKQIYDKVEDIWKKIKELGHNATVIMKNYYLLSKIQREEKLAGRSTDIFTGFMKYSMRLDEDKNV